MLKRGMAFVINICLMSLTMGSMYGVGENVRKRADKLKIERERKQKLQKQQEQARRKAEEARRIAAESKRKLLAEQERQKKCLAAWNKWKNDNVLDAFLSKFSNDTYLNSLTLDTAKADKSQCENLILGITNLLKVQLGDVDAYVQHINNNGNKSGSTGLEECSTVRKQLDGIKQKLADKYKQLLLNYSPDFDFDILLEEVQKIDIDLGGFDDDFDKNIEETKTTQKEDEQEDNFNWDIDDLDILKDIDKNPKLQLFEE